METLTLDDAARASLLSDDSLDPHKLIVTVDGVGKSFYDWTLEYADKYFPDLEKNVYRVPAVNFNIPGKKPKIEVAGVHVPILSQVNESHAKGDLATRLVCEALERLGHELGSLAIVTNFQFENYLNRIETPAGATLRKPKDKTSRGDLDVLAMNVQSGPVVIEVKSVGYEIVDWSKDHEENLSRVKKQLIGEETRTYENKDMDKDDDGGDKEKEKEKGKDKALDQVQKAKDVFDYVMSDLDSGPQAIKVVALPFVPRAILDEIAADIAVHDKSDGVCFLCKDDLPDTNSATTSLKSEPVQREAERMAHSKPSKLCAWWDENIASKRQSVSVVTLKAIMGRFCGLLSTVSVWSSTKSRAELRTKGEAASEAGKRFSDIVLTLRQVEILQDENMAVGLRGPPGSGKTMLLAIKGRHWVNQGHKVIVAIAQSLGGGVPSGFSLQKMVEDGAKKGTLAVDMVEVPFSKRFDPKVFDDELAKLGDLPRKHVHFLMDEFAYRDVAPQILHYLVHEKRVSVWWAVLHSSDMPEVEGYTYFRLDRAMRSPPCVQRLLKKLEWNAEWQDSYTTRSEFEGLPTDGPPIACVRHARHAQPGLLPIECQECAEEIADFLINDLGVGISLPVASPVSASYQGSENQASTIAHQMSSSYCITEADVSRKKPKNQQQPKTEESKSKTPIKYEDVILLIQIPMSMLVKLGDNFYQIVPQQYQEFWDNLPSGPFMTHIRKRGLPVEIMSADIPRDIAIPSPGHINVTIDGLAWGLERTVVVVLATDIVSDDTFQDPSVLDNVNYASQSTSTKKKSAETSYDKDISTSPEGQEIAHDTSSPSASCRAEHVLPSGLAEQLSGTARGLQTTELQKTNEKAISASAARCLNPLVPPAAGTVTGDSEHKVLKQTTEQHRVSDDEKAAPAEQGPADMKAIEPETTGVCEEDDEKTLLELVRKLPTYHQQMLFVAASRSVSQLVLTIPTTWEK